MEAKSRHSPQWFLRWKTNLTILCLDFRFNSEAHPIPLFLCLLANRITQRIHTHTHTLFDIPRFIIKSVLRLSLKHLSARRNQVCIPFFFHVLIFFFFCALLFFLVIGFVWLISEFFFSLFSVIPSIRFIVWHLTAWLYSTPITPTTRYYSDIHPGVEFFFFQFMQRRNKFQSHSNQSSSHLFNLFF